MKNLRCKYKTGRSKRHNKVSSTKYKPTYTYEITVITPSGEFKEKEWEVLVAKQAKELLETDILKLLKDYNFNPDSWLDTHEKAYKYALDLYASRVWEDKEWVKYEEFNKLLNKKECAEQISLI